jgi:hypothetical protein
MSGPKPHPWNTKNRIALKKAIRGWSEIKPSQFATLHGLSVSWVRKLCRAGRIQGAHLFGPTRYWAIPKNAKILEPGDAQCHRLYLVEVEGGMKVNSYKKNIMAYAEATETP